MLTKVMIVLSQLAHLTHLRSHPTSQPLLCWSSTDPPLPEEDPEEEVAGSVAGGTWGRGRWRRETRVHSINIQTMCQVLGWGNARFCEEERVKSRDAKVAETIFFLPKTLALSCYPCREGSSSLIYSLLSFFGHIMSTCSWAWA